MPTLPLHYELSLKMGNSFDRLVGYDDSSADSAIDGLDNRRKRKGEPGETPPKKITKLDTAKYVYERLFLQGEGSDVTVHAVGHVWHLHKLYLQQCKYFEVLMQGNWKDSKENVIHLNFPDTNVTREGLHAVLGSLYHNQIELDLDKAEGVLSAASVLQLESVLERCGDAMAENLVLDNALHYLNLAEMYGLPQVIRCTYTYLDTWMSRPHCLCKPQHNFHFFGKCWRWAGFNNGVDIVSLKGTWRIYSATPYSINLKNERVIHYRWGYFQISAQISTTMMPRCDSRVIHCTNCGFCLAFFNRFSYFNIIASNHPSTKMIWGAKVGIYPYQVVDLVEIISQHHCGCIFT
uniref:BTB domain-containing protein n=1 Tax=Angiostrongylus cantonensis TaxID=6313 RepID=A0A0K0DI59_ANGCA